MDILSFNALASYWSAALVATNILIFFNILGALVLGLLVGYERAYHGHAAGMRTYGLVYMASAALTVIAGYPGFWFGGQVATAANVDPTRVVQGIVTGIGFLGAGVIMKEIPQPRETLSGSSAQRMPFRSPASCRSNGRRSSPPMLDLRT
jgi:putative Mg2+ transporter-C (MgtC) family protein